MVTAGVPSWNIILSDEFYIFDGAQKLKSNWWTKKTPRKVKVTFEKALGQYEEYCLRLLDPTGRHSPVYYHLGSERSAFFGTDRGKLTCKKKLLDLRSSVTYSFLTVYVACGDLMSRQSCVLLKTDWPEEKQEHWQSTINEALGLRGSWSVERNVGKNSERERVLLSLTSRGLALNSKNLSDGRELPTCLWYHTFSDFTMVANFSATESTIKISCRQKGVQEKLVEYDLITSQGQAISSAIYKVSGLKPILPPIHLGSPNPKTQTVDVDETTPPPCPNSRIFANKPSSVKSHNIPSIKSKDTSLLPLPAPGSPVNQTFSDNPESKSQLRMRSPRNYRHARNRVVGPEDMQPTDNDKDKHFHRKPSNKSSHIYSSLRRSFSLGEKEFKGISRYRKTKRGGVSLGDGYGSESNDIDQLAPAAHEGDADRGTLYLHNKWFNVFKGQLPVQGFTGGVTTFSVCRPNIREQLSSGGQQDTVDDDYYWTKEISFSLQKVLENKVPHPDTMKLTRRQRIRLTFLLYPTTAGLSGGWQELAGYLGLTLQDVAIVENFCLFHHYGPIEILLLHWQFVYNKQEKPQHRHLLSEPLIPPCTQSQLTTYLLKMKRSDIIEACNFVTLDTTCI